MPFEGLAQKPFGRGQIASFTEPEFNGVAMAVDGAIEIPPLSTNFDACLVHVPIASDRTLASIELLQQEGRIVDGPAMDRGMIDKDAALGHHLFHIPQAQAVSQIPSDAQQDHRAIEMPAPEHATLHR